MPEYPHVHVLATIRVKIADRKAKKFGPTDAQPTKIAAAAWLREQEVSGADVKIDIRLEQSSPDVSWEDRGDFTWEGEAEHGREYAAQFIERFPEWGRGR